MKKMIVFCGLCWSLSLAAHQPYHLFLQTQAQTFHRALPATSVYRVTGSLLPIPKIETPRGAVFCRLEDYLTQKTKVWIKVGVR